MLIWERRHLLAKIVSQSITKLKEIARQNELDKAILTLPNNHTPPKPNQAASTPKMRPRIALQR